MMESRIRLVAITISGGRVAIGIATVLVPGIALRMMGLPRDHDNASARMMARLFGVREIALGAAVIAMVQSTPRQPKLYALNAGVDAGDAAVLGLSLAGGNGVSRAALGSMAVAVPVTATWLWLRRLSA
jgi:hypothetical protein